MQCQIFNFVCIVIYIESRRCCCNHRVWFFTEVIEDTVAGPSNEEEPESDTCHACGFTVPPSAYKGKGKGKRKVIPTCDVDWVQCDICSNWYHCVCLKINIEELPESYECPNCAQ